MSKNAKRQPQGEIKPFQAYSTTQTADLLGVNPATVRSLADDLNGKKIGKEYLFLGESILRYLGSVSYTPTNSPINPMAAAGAVS